jgi:hypothetical protein
MFKLKKFLVAVIAVLTLYGVEARGDSFEITDVHGALYVSASMDAGPPTLKLRPIFYLSGPGLSVSSNIPPNGGGDVGNVEARDFCQTMICVPGTVVGTNSSFSGVVGPYGARAIVNGVQYYTTVITGSLNLVSQPIVLPNVDGNAQITIPFSFSGEITGNAYQPNVVNPIFTATLSGRGLATFVFYYFPKGMQSPRYLLNYIEYRFEPVPISIDIKPATFPNSINPKSRGRIPVAILSTSFFDATDADPATILFGANGLEAAPVQSAIEDVNGDGRMDLVLHFLTQETGITCETSSVSLTGETFSGVKITGSDFIETAGCH